MGTFLEKTLEDIIFENRGQIHEKGFCKLYENCERQFVLPSLKKIDILSWEVRDEVLYAKIIELKRNICDEIAFWQGVGYYAEFMPKVINHFKECHIDLVLCGSDYSSQVWDLCFFDIPLEIFTYKYAWDGVRFENWHTKLLISDHKNWRLTNKVNTVEHLDFANRLKIKTT